jgi:hypothetical protein
MMRTSTALVVVIVGAALALNAAVTAPYALDYPGSSLEVNRTGDAVQALANLDFGKFFATQPAIGPVSVVVRAPFAALAGIGHDLVEIPASYHGDPPVAVPPRVFDSQLRLYRFGVFPCALALVLLAAFAAATAARHGRPWWLQLLAAALVLGLPLWDGAIHLGHPEEFLTTALTLGAVLAAVSGRAGWAAVLLGVALATKQWAVLALPAVVLAVDAPVVKRVVATTVAVYVAIMIPMAIGDPGRFADTLTAPGTTAHGLVGTDSNWFQIAAHDDRRIFDGVEHITIAHRRLPHVVESASHPFIALLAAGLAILLWRRRQQRDAASIFQLLALIFLVRCLLDPVTNDYYHLPFLAALALSEVLSERRLPILTLLATAAFLPDFGIDVTAFGWANAFYLAWSIPLTAWLAMSLYRKRVPAQPLRPKL